jgi:hypothetical protein
MIVPEIAGSAGPELDELRSAADLAIKRLLSVAPDVLVVVGGAARTEHFSYPYSGTFAPWGAPAAGFAFGGRPVVPITALSLLVGGWLVSRHDLTGRTLRLSAVGASTPTGSCVAFGADLADRRPRVALLVLGDGSACRGEKSPGYDDPRARSYDDGVAAALADADTDALLGLDPGLSVELRVAGRAPWQVLAGAARAAGGHWAGDLAYYAAPYGVGYFVANWARTDANSADKSAEEGER